MNKPKCVTVMPWLKAQFGKTCLAPLTTTDALALAAAVQCAELWAWTGGKPTAATAFGDVVVLMQEKTRYLAYHVVAHCAEWTDRERLWQASGMPPLARVGVCAYEPGGAQRTLEGRVA